jgi:hypothetical protein
MNFVATKTVQSSRVEHICDGCLKRLGIGSSLVKHVYKEDGEFYQTALCVPCEEYLRQHNDSINEEWYRGDIGDWRKQEERV